MTSRPSITQTGFCSPSRTRRRGAVPFARKSLSWSVTYCSGFPRLTCVAVSDIVAAPFICSAKTRGCLTITADYEANGAAGKLPSLRFDFSGAHAVWVHQDFSGQSTLQQREGVFKFFHWGALAEQR